MIVSWNVTNKCNLLCEHCYRDAGKKAENERYVNPVVVDTSALIDGRIADMVDSGFFYGTLVVPRFILSELQHIADASKCTFQIV